MALITISSDHLVQANAIQLNELSQLIDTMTGQDGPHPTAIKGLHFYRSSHPTKPEFYFQEPALYVVVQGCKRITFGEDLYIYDPSTYLTVSMDLPTFGEVLEASENKPYLGLILTVDPKELANLIIESGRALTLNNAQERALSLSQLNKSLLEALIRMVRLLNTPQDISIFAPMIKREITYHLLQGAACDHLTQIAIGDSRMHRISNAITWLKQNYKEPLHIDALARHANMSTSGLHVILFSNRPKSTLQYKKLIC